MDKSSRLGSADELKPMRKKGALPLAVFLSFNDRDVHPHCPNSSNPYHKCGRHCLDKISPGNRLLDKERAGGSSSELEKMIDKKEVNAICPNASNPFHKCAEYCFEKSHEKRQYVLKEPEIKMGVLVTVNESSENTESKYAYNPYDKCDELCSESSPGSDHIKDVMKPKEQKLARNTDTRINSECKNALNPFHVCAEYCFQADLERDINPKKLKERQKIVNMVEIAEKPKKNRERKKIVNIGEIVGVNPQCRFASNRFHKCAEYCFQNMEEDISHDAPIKAKKDDHRKERTEDHLIMEKSESSDNIGVTSHSNNTDSSKGITIHLGTNESVSEKETGTIELLDTQPLRIDASDLFQEWAKYCSLKAMEDSEDKAGKSNQRDEQRTRRDKRYTYK